MKNSIRFLLITLIFYLFSCKKDAPVYSPIAADTSYQQQPLILSYDTLYPFSYLPAFPGSFWKYIDDNGDTSIIVTDSAYILDYYQIGGSAYVSDSFYVPVYNNYPLWGYEEHSGPISNAGSYPLKRLLSDSLPVGSEWGWLYWFGNALSRKIIAIDTTVVINGSIYFPTIAIEQFYSLGPPFYIWQKREYYTKNIGLIKTEEYNSLDSSIFSRVLIDHFINQ